MFKGAKDINTNPTVTLKTDFFLFTLKFLIYQIYLPLLSNFSHIHHGYYVSQKWFQHMRMRMWIKIKHMFVHDHSFFEHFYEQIATKIWIAFSHMIIFYFVGSLGSFQARRSHTIVVLFEKIIFHLTAMLFFIGSWLYIDKLFSRRRTKFYFYQKFVKTKFGSVFINSPFLLHAIFHNDIVKIL